MKWSFMAWVLLLEKGKFHSENLTLFDSSVTIYNGKYMWKLYPIYLKPVYAMIALIFEKEVTVKLEHERKHKKV